MHVSIRLFKNLIVLTTNLWTVVYLSF